MSHTFMWVTLFLLFPNLRHDSLVKVNFIIYLKLISNCVVNGFGLFNKVTSQTFNSSVAQWHQMVSQSLVIISPHNGLMADQSQAITWTKAKLSLIGTLANFKWNKNQNEIIFI